ncbi:MAG: hypothetical protein WEB59_06225 [Thermoanaerobaculia bacterium]
MVKTSLKIPDGLWEGAKVVAAQERRDLADVVAEALADYLAPASLSPLQLLRVGVTLADEDRSLLRCNACQLKWTPVPKPDGKLRRNYWQCPTLCNAPSDQPFSGFVDARPTTAKSLGGRKERDGKKG